MNVTNINLNLLRALDALLTEQHVGRAATRLGVTQSAMSHTLRQLRQMFDDPLLVRAGRRMVPTSRAEALAPLLRDGLGLLDRALYTEERPNPHTFDDTFTLAIGDGPVAPILAPLFSRFATEAPNATLRIVQPGADLRGQLFRGDAHAAVIPPVEVPAGIAIKPLAGTASERFVVLGRLEHPALPADRVDLDTYCKLPHIMLSLTGEGGSFIDAALARLGRQRRVVLRLPYALAMPIAVRHSDAIVTVVDVMADTFAQNWPLRAVAAPLEFGVGEMAMGWHKRFDAHPAHVWFRELIESVMADVTAELRASGLLVRNSDA